MNTWDDYQAELSNDPGYGEWLDDLDSKTHQQQQQEEEMSLISKTEGSEGFRLVPEGTHLARCYLMVDIGLQETPFGDKEKVVLDVTTLQTPEKVPQVAVDFKRL